MQDFIRRENKKKAETLLQVFKKHFEEVFKVEPVFISIVDSIDRMVPFLHFENLKKEPKLLLEGKENFLILSNEVPEVKYGSVLRYNSLVVPRIMATKLPSETVEFTYPGRSYLSFHPICTENYKGHRFLKSLVPLYVVSCDNTFHVIPCVMGLNLQKHLTFFCLRSTYGSMVCKNISHVPLPPLERSGDYLNRFSRAVVAASKFSGCVRCSLFYDRFGPAESFDHEHKDPEYKVRTLPALTSNEYRNEIFPEEDHLRYIQGEDFDEVSCGEHFVTLSDDDMYGNLFTERVPEEYEEIHCGATLTSEEVIQAYLEMVEH